MTDETGWIDISVPLKTGMVHYPGDPDVRVFREEDMEQGDAINLTSITMSVHTGTHVDAPLHFLKGGLSIDALPPGALNGRARVIAIEDPVAITPGELEPHGIEAGEVLLFKTRNSALRRDSLFREDYVYLSTPAADYLAKKRIRTLGIDYLSVGGFHTNEAEVHRLLLSASVWIIENLDLTAIEPGNYDLLCLPLRIEGAEAAPARAFLKALPSDS